MAAGTVISGGFPGRVAQEVQPNQKCNGCLHFDGQGGRTGICTIGLRPWLCGEDGSAQDIGYAPIASGAGAYLPEMSNHGAHAAETTPQPVSSLYGAGSTRGVQVQQVSLGEEHVHMVKSMVEGHVRLQKSQCNLCSMKDAYGVAPANVGLLECTCQPLPARDVAKALVPKMSNAQRQSFTADSLIEWVRDVVKSGFKMPKKARSLGSKVEGYNRAAEDKAKPGRLAPQLRVVRDPIGNGGHLQKKTVEKAIVSTAEAVDKSIYSEDWLLQFKGTSLFKEAHALCEKELELEEAQLKRREERAKHEKQRNAALAKIKPIDYDWEQQDAERTRVRLQKQRLTLKLAALQASGKVTKSEQDDDIEKAIDNEKHSHVVTGRLAGSGIGVTSRQSGSRKVDNLDKKYGASAHSVSRNPNFKPKTLKFEKHGGYGPGAHAAEAGHGRYVTQPEKNGGHNLTYMPHGQGEEGHLHGGWHATPAAAHAAAQEHHQKTIGG